MKISDLLIYIIFSVYYKLYFIKPLLHINIGLILIINIYIYIY